MGIEAILKNSPYFFINFFTPGKASIFVCGMNSPETYSFIKEWETESSREVLLRQFPEIAVLFKMPVKGKSLF